MQTFDQLSEYLLRRSFLTTREAVDFFIDALQQAAEKSINISSEAPSFSGPREWRLFRVLWAKGIVD
jgi:hypothetical protein